MREGFYKGYIEELEKVGLLNLVGAAAGLMPVAGSLAPWASRALGMSKANVARAGQFARFTRRPLGIGLSLGVPLATSFLSSRNQRQSQPQQPPPTFQTPQMPQRPPSGYGMQQSGYY